MKENSGEKSMQEIVGFYSKIGRPLTLLEMHRATLGSADKLEETLQGIEHAREEKKLSSEDGFFALPTTQHGFSLARRRQDFVADKKWKRLVKLGGWFSYVPFVEFVLVNGSMALGNVTPSSDFDVLVCVRKGRIFTARYVALFVFALLGARRTKDRENDDPNKLCFNHFVTTDTFKKPPFNTYRYHLYRTMIPLWGDENMIQFFFDGNKWCDPPRADFEDLRYQKNWRSTVRRFLEALLSGALGTWIEVNIIKPFAQKRLQKYVDAQHAEGRVALSDDELEFHFNLSGEKRFS